MNLFLEKKILFGFIMTLYLFFVSVSLGEINYPYVHEPVTEPVADGIRLTIPAGFDADVFVQLGMVDVTAAPFFADRTGRIDSTKAIQQAINFARDNQLVCFFPEGTYLVSDTISCIQNRYKRANGNVRGAPNFPCVLSGSRKGNRPKIVLANCSPGFSDPANPKYVIHFWTRGLKNEFEPSPNSSFNQTIENLEIVIGEGNSGAIGIRMRGAQGSNIINCAIDATYGFKGFEGGPGSGGGIYGLTVLGGKIGMDMTETQPAPTISAIVLEEQQQAAIIYGGRQSLSAVGIRIRFKGNGPAIRTPEGKSGLTLGQIALSDASIECLVPVEVAIDSDSSVYLSNVYIKGANVLVKAPAGKLDGDSSGWICIQECAIGKAGSKFRKSMSFPVYVDGFPTMKPYSIVSHGQKPPKDLVEKHSCNTEIFWENSKVVNVKEFPYNACGDGLHDDTEAIQKAIDDNNTVFFPKGYYLISRSLILKKESSLLGVAKHLSIIYTRPGLGDFTSIDAPNPLIKTAKGGGVLLANLCLYAPRDSGSYALCWRAGESAVLQFVNIMNVPLKKFEGLKLRTHPFVLIENPGQGRWYGLYHHGDHKQQSKDYRLLLVDGSQGPLDFYQVDLEHAKSDANMEIRNSSGISIYGLKSEGNSATLLIKNSQDIRVLGFGGNASAFPGKALFVINNSTNVRLVNLVNTPRKGGDGNVDGPFGVGVATGQWHMVADQDRGLMTDGFHRPVLYLIH